MYSDNLYKCNFQDTIETAKESINNSKVSTYQPIRNRYSNVLG